MTRDDVKEVDVIVASVGVVGETVVAVVALLGVVVTLVVKVVVDGGPFVG